jgi:integrase
VSRRLETQIHETALRVHLIPELGYHYLDQITRRALDALFDDWAIAGPRYQERVQLARDLAEERAREQRGRARPVRLGCAPKTISNAIVPLREMLGHAVQWGYIASNPAAGLKRPRDNRSPEDTMRVLAPEQVNTLLEAAEVGLERTLLLTAVTTGARMGELRALTWADFDRDRKRLWVRRSIGHNGVQHPKSRRSIRAIALTPTACRALVEYRLASAWSDENDFIFASSRGTPLDSANVRRLFRGALKRAGLPTMRFHDLRHCYASLLVAQGAHPKFISEQLGHASTQITMDRYSHLLDQSYTDESNKLEAVLFGNGAPARWSLARAAHKPPAGRTQPGSSSSLLRGGPYGAQRNVPPVRRREPVASPQHWRRSSSTTSARSTPMGPGRSRI